MEVVHVVLGKANPARMNGVNKVVNELATQQAMAGNTVSLWGITGSVAHDYPQRPYTTRLFKAQRNPFHADPAMVAALDDYKGRAVFHLHGGFIPVFCTLARILHQKGIPFVFTPHGSYNVIALQKSRWRKKVYLQLFEKKLLQYAQSIHCLGKSEVDGLQKLYPNDKTVLIPYGFEGAALPVIPLPVNEFIIGFCGRIDIYTKGLDLLLDAFALFKKQVPQARLWIIGDSRERAYLEKRVQDGELEDKVTFWGSCFGEEKIKLLQQLQLFVHPSRNEGLPTAVLEAASLGIPCVVTEATNVGDGIRQYDCGAVIEKPEALALYKALQKLYSAIQINGRDYLSENARRMVHELYNWQLILDHFNALYQRA